MVRDGPLTKAYVKKNPEVLRTIRIRGDQTLEDLHHAIFDAYDREDEVLDAAASSSSRLTGMTLN